MSAVKLALAAGCLLLTGIAGAQITIESGDVPQTIGDSCRYKYVANSATVDNGLPGGPHTWTFDTASYVGYVLTTTIVDKATTPFAASFPDANLATREPRGAYTLFVYDKVQTDGLLELGYGADFGGGGKVWKELPSVVNVQFPATLGVAWQTSYTVNDTTGDTVRVAAGTRWCAIDAWGTAIVPAGSHECLRENWVGVTITTTYVSGSPVSTDTSFGRRYLWMAKAVGVVAMTHSMEHDTNPNFTEADDIMVMVQTSAGGIEEGLKPQAASFKLGPTIVRGVVLLPGSPSTSSSPSWLLDITGRPVLPLRVGPNDVSHLAPGVYFIREGGGTREQGGVRRVVVTR
jgi:hypothetical protein